MILIAYDGSDDAKAAVEETSKLFPGEDVTVLNVWQRFIDTMARAGTGMAMMVDFAEIDESSEKAAIETADAGAAIAKEAGMQAVAKTAVVETSVADAILREAEELEAKVLVLGTRGLTGVKSLVLGSTSHAVLHHSDRPVLVIPSPVVAAERAKHLAHIR